MALRSWKRGAALALMGALGFGLGLFPLFMLGFLGLLPSWTSIAMGLGVVGGAALGLVFENWKRTAVLTLVGLLGFSAGEGVAAVLEAPLFGSFLYSQQALLQGPPLWVNTLDEGIREAVGGASLGAALGYLKKSELVGG